jgi:hypothetical protein
VGTYNLGDEYAEADMALNPTEENFMLKYIS